MKIKITYKARDGFKEIKTFKALKSARKYATDWVGDSPDQGVDYAVSFDGVGTIRCEGCSLDELFKEDSKSKKIDKVVNTIITAVNEKKENEMELKMKENFVIGSSDARFSTGPLKKAKDAVKAVKGVEAVEAVEAVKANKKEKIVAVKAVKAVTGVKAVDAVPATPQVQTAYFRGKTKEICAEILARCADQNMVDAMEGQILEDDKGGFYVVFKAEEISTLRGAFKKCKSKDGYNAPGLKALKDKETKDKAAKKEAEKKAAAKAKVESDKKAAQEKAPEKEKGKSKGKEKETPPGVDVDWPENFDE